MGFPRWLSGKEFVCQHRGCRRQSLIPGWEDLLEEEMQPTSVSCPENPLGRGVWQPVVHRVTKSRTRLNDLAQSVNTQVFTFIKIH